MPLHYLGWRQATSKSTAGTSQKICSTRGLASRCHGQSRCSTSASACACRSSKRVRRKESLYLSRLAELKPVASVLHHIHARHGEISFAIVSGSPRTSIVDTLKRLGLLDLFPVLVGAEDYARGKPDPEPFLTAASRLGVAPADCLVFEDAEAGIASAPGRRHAVGQGPGPQWVMNVRQLLMRVWARHGALFTSAHSWRFHGSSPGKQIFAFAKYLPAEKNCAAPAVA